MTIYRPSARVRLTLRTEEFSDTEPLVARLPAESGLGTLGAPATPEPPRDTQARDAASARRLSEENQAALMELFAEMEALPPEEFDRQLETLERQRDSIQHDADGYSMEIGEAEMVTTPAATSGTTTLIEVGEIEVSSGDGSATIELGEVVVFTGGSAVGPTSVDGNASDDITVVGDITPISATIERNGLATAHTCTVVLNAADAPLDPRVLRSAHVVVTIGVSSAGDFQDGSEYSVRREDGTLLSLVDPDSESSTRFVGFVDDVAVAYGEQGDTVTLECRDMSAVLRDGRFPAGVGIDLTLPIDEGVAAFMEASSAASAGVRVRWAGDGPAPVPADVTGGGTARRRGRRRGANRARARTGGQDMSIWDHITDTCRAIGVLPVVDGFDVVLTEARTLFSSTNPRRMVLGENLSELSFSRRLQGVKVPTIEVRSYDPTIGRTRWARFPVRTGERASGILGREDPPKPLRANEVPPSGANPENSIRTILVSGVSSPALLERVAQNAFEQLGRQEIEGSFSTDDAWSFGREPADVDLLKLNAGDPVELLVRVAVPEQDQGVTTLAQIQAMTRDRRTEYLVSRGWPENVARRFAALQEATEFQTVFRVQDVRVQWDNENGISLNVGFVNYITAREDEAAPEQEEAPARRQQRRRRPNVVTELEAIEITAGGS